MKTKRFKSFYRGIGIHEQGAFVKGHRRVLLAQESELMPFVIVDLFFPGRFDRLNLDQFA
jgi:hypothetical protein